MSGFVVAATSMLLCMVPLGVVAVRGTIMEGVVAYEGASSILVLMLMLLPQAFNRSGLFEFPVLMAVLALGSGLVFLRAVERWL
ncbi:MAG TPA: hypothetical protein VMD28_01365 [Acidimicrobiales bacterium]|nr:hypothetical protein [Acidimicrobiales bacterium]